MNKLIKQLLENLFDDYDDVFQDDTGNDYLDNKMAKDIQDREEKWIHNNISLSTGNPSEEDAFINNIDNYVTFEYVNYQLNLEFTKTIRFNCPIPDYVEINKIKGDCTFSSFDNLPNEVDGNMEIISEETKITGPLPQKIKSLCINCPNLKSLKGIVFPQKMESLYINCPKLKSLEGINDSNVSIDYVTIKDCKNLQDLTGLPDSVGNLSLENCNFTNLKGCSKQLNVLNIRSCDKLENLIGCPESVNYIFLSKLDNFRSLEGCPSQLNVLNIEDCEKLKSLKHISPLITKEFAFFRTGLIDLSNGPKEIQGNYEFMFNPNLKCLNAQDTVMTGHDTIFHCYGNDSLKELTGLPKMKYKDIKINTERQ